MSASTFANQFIFLLGALDAFDVTFVNTNADGTVNDQARAGALQQLIEGGVSSGALISLPGLTVPQVVGFANVILAVVVGWKAATGRPTLP